MDNQSFEEVKARWSIIFKDPLLSLTSLREKGVKGKICSQSLRSVCWKLYLAYLPSLDTATWPLTLHKERQHYADLRQKYITSPASESENDTANDLNINNPLSLDQANPWQEFFKDNELRKIIRQDVERTFPDNKYFRTPLSQSRLLDILFIYCKMNQDVSYRQGMHELLAPILWVVDKESIPNSEYAVENDEDTIIKQTLNADYVEHDTFALFSALMKSAKVYYEYNDEIFNRKPVKRPQGSDLEYARIIKDAQAEAAKSTPVVKKCNNIYDVYLKTIDFELYSHLKNLEIEPQLYGIRWIRLLFGREFPLDKVLILWDGMFAEDPTLRIVDFVCVAMMLLIRDELLVSDYAGCLSMLMRYPPTSDASDVEVLVKQSIYLRDHLTPEGGTHIIKQNAIRKGKPLPVLIPSSKGLHKIEGLVPEGFVNVLESNVNKAILNVVGEVKRNVNALRKDVQIRTEYDRLARSSPADYSQRFAHSAPNSLINQQISNNTDPSHSEVQNTFEEVKKLKEQNRQMAKIIQKSIEILEQEILERTKSREITNAMDAEKIEKSSDDSESRSSFEYISNNNNEDSATLSANGISALQALHGLKHIKDVLNGSIKEFNPHIMEITSNGEDHDHWEVVDDGTSVVSMAGTEDETASITKETQTKQNKIITPTSSSVTISKTPAVETISTKYSAQPISSPLQPSPPSSFTKVTPTQTIQQRSNITNSTSIQNSPKTSKPIFISHQKSKLKIEDILNDVENSETGIGTPKPSIASNSKYSWMIEGYADDDDNSLFNPKRASIGSINSLSGFSSDRDFSKDTDDDIFNKPISTSSQKRTKNSVIASSTPLAPSTSSTSSTSSSLYSGRIDPLGASPLSTNQEDTESIESTSSEQRSSSTNTHAVPIDDPLGVL